jgi:hypothetical protein
MNEVDMPLRGPGYLDMPRADEALRVAAKLWLADNLPLYEGGAPLPYPGISAARVSLAADRSFAAWDSAIAHVRAAPIAPGTDLYWKQQYLDVLLEYPIASESSEFSIHPRLARLGLKVLTTLRFLPPGGEERAFEFHGDPGLVHLDPRWLQAALRFVEAGFFHILDGSDHLLFVACLVIPFRRLRPLVIIATAFTVAHSITLSLAALGVVVLPSRWVESAIAASVVLASLNNVWPVVCGRRWVLAFVFGLIHGFGFASVLADLGLPQDSLLLALVAFNVGVEAGQLAIVAAFLPVANALRDTRLYRRTVLVFGSLMVAAVAAAWLAERALDVAVLPGF